jgi:HlyD family secretion protein
VDQLKIGMKVTIQIHAFPDQAFDGTVTEISPLPDAPVSNNVKVYTTKVKINNDFPALRPGMSADAEILIAKLENVLKLPVEAILTDNEHFRVAVRKPDGAIEIRRVELGLSDEKVVEVKKGLSIGESVVLDPAAFIGRQVQNPAPPASTKRKSSR